MKAKCAPCGGAPPLTQKEAKAYLQDLPGWSLKSDGKAIRTEYTLKDFVFAVELIRRIAKLAESQGHHPDLHLTRYRHLAIELSTHAIQGLSENDFILAAKINRLPKI